MLDACSGKLTHKYCMTWVRSYIFSQYVIFRSHYLWRGSAGCERDGMGSFETGTFDIRASACSLTVAAETPHFKSVHRSTMINHDGRECFPFRSPAEFGHP